MRVSVIRCGLAVAALGFLGLAQAQFLINTDAILDEPIPLLPEALGSFTHPISSDVAEAQAYFDQGFQLMYAYGKAEAIRSFREAWRRDPDCAICYWGEAWAWGSYLNAGMTTAEAPHAFAALQQAIELREHGSPKEQAYIDALSARYATDYDVTQRRRYDLDYALAMRELAEAYPDDLDAVTLYADALFLLEERRGYRDIEDPRIDNIRRILESVLERDIRHVGACHLYIHLTESTERPELAEPCAEFIGTAVPGASHLNHMPSHTWNEIGRWGDSVRANLMAWHSDQKAAINEGVAIYPTHNLQMLLFAASYDGQGAIAMRAAEDFTDMTGDKSHELLVRLRFGRFDEVLELTEPAGGDWARGVWEFAQGYARLRNDEPEFAAAHLTRLERIIETTNARVRFDAASDVLGVLSGILLGEIYRAEGDMDAAIESFERAVAQEDDLNYDEPEIVPFPARHWLGAALLEAGDYRDAERVYRAELEDHPHNGWSLLGLRQALAARGRTEETVEADFEQSWARSDVWISASRF
jgi:tetratricopeptide (TPR) repeat protein